jgi:hypothetical protein
MRKCNNCLEKIKSSDRICPYCRCNIPYAQLSYGKGSTNLAEAATALLLFGVVMLVVGFLMREPWTSNWNITSAALIGLGMVRFFTKNS